LICHGINLAAYKVHAPKKRVNDFLINEYVAPFQASVQTACRDYLPLPEGFPSDMESGDICALFFEENDYIDYIHTAIESVRLMREDQELWWRSRIGKLTHGTKTGPAAIPLLQIADLGVFLGGRVIGESPDGRIPWTRYYEKLRKAKRVWGRPGKISKNQISILKGLHETLEREKRDGNHYWDDL
jgi:hypothetical protein